MSDLQYGDPVGTPALGSAPVGTHVGTHALGSVCTGTFDYAGIMHDGPTCPVHDMLTGQRPVFVVTNAPAAYDYDHTTDTGRTEVRYRATCRLVVMDERHTRHQIDRYLSGAYVAEVW